MAEGLVVVVAEGSAEADAVGSAAEVAVDVVAIG